MQNTLDPKTAASPVMIAVIAMRCRQHLHLAIDSIRNGEPMRAAYHLGIAQGQVNVLYATPHRAWLYLKACRKVYTALNTMTRRASEHMMLQYYDEY